MSPAQWQVAAFQGHSGRFMPGQPLESKDAPSCYPSQSALSSRTFYSALSHVAGERSSLASVTRVLDSTGITLTLATTVAATWMPWSQSHLCPCPRHTHTAGFLPSFRLF